MMLAAHRTRSKPHGADHRLVEVIEVVAEISLVGPMGAEVFQVQVAADEDVRAGIQRTEFGPVAAKQVSAPRKNVNGSARIFRSLSRKSPGLRSWLNWRIALKTPVLLGVVFMVDTLR